MFAIHRTLENFVIFGPCGAKVSGQFETLIPSPNRPDGKSRGPVCRGLKTELYVKQI